MGEKIIRPTDAIYAAEPHRRMKQFTLLLLTSAFLAFGQATHPLASSPNLSAASHTQPGAQVGPDDLLTVAVADCPELTRNFRVLSDGTLALPLLKERIPAKNKSPEEIEAEISAALVRDQLLVQPVVSVSIAEYRSIPVSVLGAVHHPVTFQAAGGVTLLDALTRAEGLSDDAGPEILVSRSHSAASQPGLIQRIPVKGLIDDAVPSLNIRLYGGEEIRVPSAGKVYVIGNVKRTGAFPVQDRNDLSVLKVLALSEGLLPYTNKLAFIYRREAGKESRNEIPIQLTEIMKHKAPDVALLPNDILYVPDSSGRRLTAETVRAITGFGVSTMSGLVIWR